MSYARFGWGGSDVYVYMGSRGIECCGCLLQERRWVEDEGAFFGGYAQAVGPEIQTVFRSTDDAVAHFEAHIAKGHTVPDNVIPDLQADREDNERYLETGVFGFQRCYAQTGPGLLDLCEVRYDAHAGLDHDFVKDGTPEQRDALRARSRVRDR